MIHVNQKLLVTGCGGMLGEEVYLHFKNRCQVHATAINLNESWLEKLDVRNRKDVEKFFVKTEPDYIIHLAALTDLEYCESHAQEAYDTNMWGTHNIAREAEARNIPMLLVSTASIFDGEKEAYEKDDLPNPLSIYGKSKYGAELIVYRLKRGIVLRAGWMIGGGPKKDKKFVNKIIKQIQGGAKELSAIDDKKGSPSYSYDFVKIMDYLLENKCVGIFHGVCKNGGSRYDIAKFILETKGLENTIRLKKVNTSHFKKEYFASRPVSEQLIPDLFRETRDWQTCLKDYLEKFDWRI